jgi:four helix bundle protein
MGKYENFQELPVWQEAKRLYNTVLDLLERPKVPLTAGFREQLDRAALSVSNNIALGFKQSTADEAQSFISIAGESAVEVCSMVALVLKRPKLKRIVPRLKAIGELAESCGQQLKDWPATADSATRENGAEFSDKESQAREFARKAKELRMNFLRGLKPEHPLYNSAEARAARGELP